MSGSYYNEHDPYAAQWLRNLISAGHIAPGDVDERSILDVRPSDLEGYTQCHFFAGIGGWSLAARLAGWADDRPLWTGSCPCQPFSVAGAQKGQADERHLWPAFFGLIEARRPPVVMGEQVAAAVGKDWLDGVFADLEGADYACGASIVPACAVDAPHRRDRLWFVADASSGRCGGPDEGQDQLARRAEALGASRGDVVDGQRARLERLAGYGDHRHQPRWIDAQQDGSAAATGGALSDAHGQPSRQGREIDRRGDCGGRPQSWAGFGRNSRDWDNATWAVGADGKARRVPEPESGIRLLAHGVPARVGKLRAYGNAIVPAVAAEIIGAYMEAA